MIDSQEKVREFHRTFDIPIEAKPILPSQDRFELRKNLIQEEFNEFIEAYGKGDLVEVADALADLQYVLDGTVLEFGLQYRSEEIFNEVHRSNMTKVWPDGTIKMREDGKILKPDTYTPPEIALIVNRPDGVLEMLERAIEASFLDGQKVDYISMNSEQLVHCVNALRRTTGKLPLEREKIIENTWTYTGLSIRVDESHTEPTLIFDAKVS